METTNISKELGNFGYFEVDSSGIVHDLCTSLCLNFGLNKNEFVGLSIEHLFKSQVSREPWKEMGKRNQAVFGIIGNEPCLVQISFCKKINWSGFVCQVILRKQDIQANDVLAFWKSMNSENRWQEKKRTQNVYTHKYSFDEIIGSSPAMKEVIELASKVAKSRSTVLITGESGTGKELFAQAIHDSSPRWEGPFVALNCAAIPDELFESELFGYEGGAFSGARRDGKAGKVELAQNGTLFLDEVSELPLLLQGKLLRVLQEREVERIGGTGRKDVDIRIIVATNKNLKMLVDEGKFRQDLYYRLHVFELKIPPLSHRKEDILPLATYFIERFNNQLGLKVKQIDSLLKHWLLNYHWPGNVRELQATIERGMNMVDGDTLTLEHIRISDQYLEDNDLIITNSVISEKGNVAECLTLEEAVANAEMSAIRHALQKSNGDRMGAAQILKIHLASLYRKLSKYNLK